MKPSQALPTDDARYLSAAEGWFELGNWNEAIHELEKITPTLRVYPDESFLTRQSHSHQLRGADKDSVLADAE